MSAFIVNKAHIDALMALAGNEFLRPNEFFGAPPDYARARDLLGQMLVNECLASVKYRYPKVTDDALPGPNDPYWLRPYVWPVLIGRTPTPVEGLKLISCYEYQSCEHPGWETSKAKEFCERLRPYLITKLPGYAEAPWEWSSP